MDTEDSIFERTSYALYVHDRWMQNYFYDWRKENTRIYKVVFEKSSSIYLFIFYTIYAFYHWNCLRFYRKKSSRRYASFLKQYFTMDDKLGQTIATSFSNAI